MDTPIAIFITLNVNMQVLEVLCQNMDVVTMEVGGYSGYGFYHKTELNCVVDIFNNNAFWYRLYRGMTPTADGPTPPCNTPESRDGPDGAKED